MHIEEGLSQEARVVTKEATAKLMMAMWEHDLPWRCWYCVAVTIGFDEDTANSSGILRGVRADAVEEKTLSSVP